MPLAPNSSTVQPLDALIRQAATCLHQGGVVAYPTEAVWGLGCDPFNQAAFVRLLSLKERAQDKGVILVAASLQQLEPWLTQLNLAQRQLLEQSWPGPHTWLVPDNGHTPTWVRGQHTQVAVRVSAHPLVVALCEAFGGPLVSTSANKTGQQPLLSLAQVRAAFGSSLDFILPGALGGLQRPTSITDLSTGQILRT